jgi:hypothetical protein
MLRTVLATRYVTPLREGGSLPAIVEADDSGLYVLKFRGAGQGPLALVAELVCGELARTLGLPVPEIVFVEVDEALGRNEPDEEIRDLLRASTGRNLALDYLPGSLMFECAAGDWVERELASAIVWFDAFTMNVDRTARNPNLLIWHRKLYLIDHGAALYFHHSWDGSAEAGQKAFPLIRDHVLLSWATQFEQAHEMMRSKLSRDVFERVLGMVPDEWLSGEGEGDSGTRRAQYVDFFDARFRHSDRILEEVLHARASLV